MLPNWFTRPLTVGDRGSDVAVVQRKMFVMPTGEFDEGLAAVVRGYQSVMHLHTSGVVDELTAEALGEEAGADLLPDWYKGQPVYPGIQGWDVVVRLLGAKTDAVAALRRFQGNHGLRPTGVVDEWTARKLGQ